MSFCEFSWTLSFADRNFVIKVLLWPKVISEVYFYLQIYFSFSISIMQNTWRPIHDNYNLDYSLAKFPRFHTLEDWITCQLSIFVVLNLFFVNMSIIIIAIYIYIHIYIYFVKEHVNIYTNKVLSCYLLGKYSCFVWLISSGTI